MRKNTVLKKNHTHILETPQSIEIDEQNAWVCDVMFFKNKVLNPVSQKLRSSNIFHKILSIRSILHKTQSVYKLGWSD